jgi:hypothetical protein
MAVTVEEQVQLKNGTNINELAGELLLKRSNSDFAPASGNEYNNSNWIKQAFLTNAISVKEIISSLSKSDIQNRSYSSASFKYQDSSLGGHHCINPPTQFTRYADIRHGGLRTQNLQVSTQAAPGDIGQGSYYSEAIDDHNQLIHLRFGVPQYNSLFQFFTGFYSSTAGSLARTGRMDDTFINKFLKFTSGVIAIAVFPLAIIPLAAMMVGSAVRYFFKWPSSKFYYLKPAMPLYWNAVESMVNQIGVNKGVIYYPFVNDQDQQSVVDGLHKTTGTEKNIFSDLLGDGLFTKNGKINVYAIANKAKRMESRYHILLNSKFEGATDDWFGKVRATIAEGGGVNVANPKETKGLTLEEYLVKWLSSPILSAADGKANFEKDLRQGQDLSKLTQQELDIAKYAPKELPPSLLEFFLAEQADGASWATFRVDYTGSVSESFSNSVGESTLAQKLNSASSSARNLRVNFADGNVGGLLGTAVDGVKSVLTGVADTLKLGGLAAFAGNAFVDIPKHWESSSASLPKSNYTLTLISPYGNPVSQMFSIYVPLCMLLAGCLPLSTGKQSHTAPFLCELYDRGRSITRLAIMDSLSIQRGVSNLGFNGEGQPMAIEVSFSVLDLSSIVSMPIAQGFSSTILDGLFDAENSFSDYLMALSAMSLRDVTDRIPMLKYQIDKKKADVDGFFSAAHFGQYVASLPGVNLLGAAFYGTDKK